MPRKKAFGNTWWGEKWLEAFSDIDDTGRLARGRTYANNGSVQQKEINHTTIQAKVKGSQRKPYHVFIELNEFSDYDKKHLLSILQENPKLWRTLTQKRTLPEELYDLLEEEEIHLFPTRWSDFKAGCSCPDFAMPCKHIAAIIYSFSKEIDENPFLIFLLHGLDLLNYIEEAAQSKRMSSIPKWESFWTLSSKHNYTAPPKKVSSNPISFAEVPRLGDMLIGLLSPNPVFFEKEDFRQTLAKTYQNLKEVIQDETFEQQILEEEQGYPWNKIEKLAFAFDNSYRLRNTTIHFKDDTKTITKGIYLLRTLVNTVPITEVKRLSESLQFWFWVYQFALSLLEKGAIIPTLWSNQDDELFVRWQPALLDQNIKQIVAQFAQMIDTKSVSLGIRLNEDERLKRHQSTAEEALLTILGKILGHYVMRAWKEVKYKRSSDLLAVKIEDLFFLEFPVSFTGYQERDAPHLIRAWIGKFLFSERQYAPILSIQEMYQDEEAESIHDDVHDDTGDELFTLEVLIEDKEQGESRRLPLAAVFQDERFEEIRLPIMQDLQSLSEYLIELKEIIDSQGEVIAEIEGERLSEMLIETFPLLQILGIKVLLPKRLEKIVRPRLTGSISSKKTRNEASFLKLGNAWEFDWQIALGNERISALEFEEMIAKKKGLWKFRDQYVLLDEKEIEKIVQQLKKKRKKPSNAQLLQTALTETYEGTRIEMDEKVRFLLDKVRQTPELKPPKKLQAVLRPYQQKGYEWLYQNARLGLGSILADDMGLGKTLQAIALLSKLKEDKELDEPALIVVPTTLLSNWQREIDKFAPNLTYFVYHGTNKRWASKKHDLWLTTYGTLRSKINNFEEVEWSTIVIDEAQAIKNPTTAQTKAINQLKSSRKIALSGTPVENRLSEYWSIFEFTNPDYLGTLKKFRTHFSIPIERDRDIERADIFRKITAPFILRRLKTDKSIISDLPDKIEQNQVCSLTKEQTALYESTVRQGLDAVEKAEGIQRRGIILQLMIALKQICNHPSHYLKTAQIEAKQSGKTALLIEILKQIIDNEEKAIIFTQYTQMGNLLKELLETTFRTAVPFLHGGLSIKQRDKAVKTFQENESLPFMLLSLKAGGTGLNLVEATHVVHFDLWWNPAVEAQATDRAYRIGQTKNVVVHRMLTQGTLEEKINTLLQAKKAIADLAVSQSDTWITEMDDSEIRSLFELGR